MHWAILIIAILCEVVGTAYMKLSHGFTRLSPTVFMVGFNFVSFILVTLALKKIDVSIAYAVWSGLGTALVALIGFYVFKEQLNPVKIIFLVMIIVGVVGLKLSES